jgi:hypothetical protein
MVAQIEKEIAKKDEELQSKKEKKVEDKGIFPHARCFFFLTA